jgi:hypothetical protein
MRTITNELLDSLSDSLKQLYETGEDYNVIIEVGKDLNDIKSFKAHSSILRARSIYFQSALSNNWATIKDNIIYFNKPNISPIIFDVILRYIYTGNIIIIEEDEDIELIKLIDLMIAADEMDFKEIIIHVQQYILCNFWKFDKKKYILLYKMFIKTHSPSQHFNKLKKKIEEHLLYNPKLLFNMNDVDLLEETSLISLIKSNGLMISEYELWKIILKWGISRMTSNNNNNNQDLKIWSKEEEEFNELKGILKNILPFIRFQEMFLKQFQQDSNIIKNLLSKEIYNNLLLKEFPIKPIDSILITEKNFNILSSYIDNKKKSNFYNSKENPYNYNLLIRQRKGSLNFNELIKLENLNNILILFKLDKKFKIIGGFYKNLLKILDNKKILLDKCFTIEFTGRNYYQTSQLDISIFNIFNPDYDASWNINLNNNKIIITTVDFITKPKSCKIEPEILEIFKLERK